MAVARLVAARAPLLSPAAVAAAHRSPPALLRAGVRAAPGAAAGRPLARGGWVSRSPRRMPGGRWPSARPPKQSERRTYLVAAVMSSLGITSMAAAAVYYRFAWQMEVGQRRDPGHGKCSAPFALSVGAAVGMEFWARWAHRALWHASLWHMHESHHRPRDGPFELNDVFAITNAVPAMSLLAYGFFTRGLVPGLCFGAGLGITLFGMAYMFVHDGLVHRRFPVGPIANVPYFRRVAAAHQIHHMDKFEGVPYGLFLGPKELEEVGGIEELEKEIKRRIKRKETLDAIQ
ncbi:hypothetical protein OsJ_09238 [Oryza sativa Japonica Group]|uniref:beta-carotene 3-hydroxylase n=1 Tax=Oryza sativa subsp. japonica TaxID=39947 RepID=A3ADN5_ORYSJ|nr:hypothetical protein OsJ_09238 [Oryza sativa Japonica Group]